MAGIGFLAGATVKLGGTAAICPVVSGASIAANTAAHPGCGSVGLTNTDGQSGSTTNGYTYASSLGLAVRPAIEARSR